MEEREENKEMLSQVDDEEDKVEVEGEILRYKFMILDFACLLTLIVF